MLRANGTPVAAPPVRHPVSNLAKEFRVSAKMTASRWLESLIATSLPALSPGLSGHAWIL